MTFNTATARFNRMGFNISAPYALFSASLDLSSYDPVRVTVRENVQNCFGTIQMELDGYVDFDIDPVAYGYFKADDHLGTEQTIWIGTIPSTDIQYNPGSNKTTINGSGMGLYLTNQYVPTECLHNTAGRDPATTIYYILGGDDWAAQTGIEPYRLVPVVDWGGTLASRSFDFDRKTTRWNAIQKILDYCRYYFHIGIRTVGGIPQACAYFVPESSIDTYCSLPSQITCTSPDGYLLPGLRATTKKDRKYNKVTVIGRLNTGVVISGSQCSSGVLNGTEIPIELIESSGSWTTQTQVDARALDLYTYYNSDAITVSGNLNQRLDLRKLQKMVLSGYSGYPTTALRLTDLTYSLNKDKWSVGIQATSDEMFRNTRLMYRVMNPDPVSDIETIFDGKAGQIATNELGTVKAVSGDGYTATVTLEDGREVEGRI